MLLYMNSQNKETNVMAGKIMGASLVKVGNKVSVLNKE